MSQIRLTHIGDGPKVAKRLIDVYFALFKVLFHLCCWTLSFDHMNDFRGVFSFIIYGSVRSRHIKFVLWKFILRRQSIARWMFPSAVAFLWLINLLNNMRVILAFIKKRVLYWPRIDCWNKSYSRFKFQVLITEAGDKQNKNSKPQDENPSGTSDKISKGKCSLDSHVELDSRLLSALLTVLFRLLLINLIGLPSFLGMLEVCAFSRHLLVFVIHTGYQQSISICCK